jgi:hypothetical protein
MKIPRLKQGEKNENRLEVGLIIGDNDKLPDLHSAASKGVAEHAIMRQSCHKKSDTVKKYIRIANMWQDCAAMKLGL